MELEDRIFWIRVNDSKKIATKNLNKGFKIYNEKLMQINDIEYRVWDPYQSKLGAAVTNGLEILPITKNSKILYLDVQKTTISHISDIVGTNGIIYVVSNDENFLNLISKPHNIIPITEDSQISSKVDVVYSNIDNNDINYSISYCNRFLKKGGFLMMIAQTKNSLTDSITLTQNYTKKLQSSYEIIQIVNLTPYYQNDGIIIAKYLG